MPALLSRHQAAALAQPGPADLLGLPPEWPAPPEYVELADVAEAAELAEAGDATESPAGSDGQALNRRKVRRGGSTAFLLQGGGVALQYGTQIVFSRALGASAFGTYTYAFNYTRIAGSLCHLGGASSALRLMPQYAVRKQWPLAAGVVRRFRQIALVVGSSVSLIAIMIVLLVSGTSSTGTAIILSAAFIPIASLIELQQAMIRACERVFRAFFPFLVLQPILLIAAVGVYLVVDRHRTVSGALLLTGGSYVVCALVQAWWLRDSLAAAIRKARPAFAARDWIKITGPIFTSNAIYLVFSRMDIVMVGLLRNPREAGIYAVAMRAGTMVNILETAMASSLAPRISHLYWSDRRDEVEDVTLKAVYWLFIPTLFITAVLSVLAHPILALFGHAFIAGTWVLIWIAFGQLISVSSGAVGWLMNMTGQQNVTAIVYAVIAALTMAGYFTLIPWLGMVGAAVANAGAVVLRNVALNVLVRQRLGYRISVLRAFRAR